MNVVIPSWYSIFFLRMKAVDGWHIFVNFSRCPFILFYYIFTSVAYMFIYCSATIAWYNWMTCVAFPEWFVKRPVFCSAISFITAPSVCRYRSLGHHVFYLPVQSFTTITDMLYIFYLYLFETAVVSPGGSACEVDIFSMFVTANFKLTTWYLSSWNDLQLFTIIENMLYCKLKAEASHSHNVSSFTG